MRIQVDDFDVGEELARVREGNAAIGAIASFVGLVRDVNAGDKVSLMTLEHYPGMTEKAIDAIVDEACARWELLDVLVVHRVGELRPTDQIVLVVVASAHREHAFLACHFIMDFLKTRAPIWKKECTGGGERWVDSRASDGEALARWDEAATPARRHGA